MATTVTYKGQTLATVENQTKTLQTAGTWCEDDFTLTDVTQGGGKWELLWTNPNPNSAISSPITVQHDMTPYEHVFVELKPGNWDVAPAFVEHLEGNNWIAINQNGNNAYVVYRWFTHNQTQFSIGADGGYVYHNGNHRSDSSYGIPVAVYGVKKLNLG